MGRTEQPQHDDRYAQAEEYMTVMYKLFQSSWRDDAVQLNREKGIYTDPELIRKIDHHGRFFDVPGPHIVQPSPQRTPLLLQAGTSKAGKIFAAQHAEAIFVSAHSPQVCAKSIAEVRQLAQETYGRNPSNIKVLALITPILGRTEEEAQAKLKDYRQYASNEGALALFAGWTGMDLSKYGDDEELRQVESNAVRWVAIYVLIRFTFVATSLTARLMSRSTVDAYAKFSPKNSKWTKHTVAEHVAIGGNGPILVGTPSQVADGLQYWVDEADVDGFNFVSYRCNGRRFDESCTHIDFLQAYALFPGSFKDIIDLLLPELKARDMFWDGYHVEGGTYRENFYGVKGQKTPLGEHVASKYHWKTGVSAQEHIIPK